MNRATSATGWARNPDGTLGYTWNVITGCLNGCPYCYARKLANGRLKQRYLANDNTIMRFSDGYAPVRLNVTDPFHPRFWEERLLQPNKITKPSGVFVCDMGELFGDWLPYEWQDLIFTTIRTCYWHRFYLLTKQPQNLIKFSPFPDNCWVGVTVTRGTLNSKTDMLDPAIKAFDYIETKKKFISFEPLLEWEWQDGCNDLAGYLDFVDWVIIGAQTNPKKLPKWEWVKEIIDACDKAGISVFLKENLGLPKYNYDGATPFYKKHPSGTMELRQEMPGGEGVKQ